MDCTCTVPYSMQASNKFINSINKDERTNERTPRALLETESASRLPKEIPPQLVPYVRYGTYLSISTNTTTATQQPIESRTFQVGGAFELQIAGASTTITSSTSLIDLEQQ